ncbi:MAG: hypothetical protein WCX95_01935 [Candidatus Gracilibacteria bacterium]
MDALLKRIQGIKLKERLKGLGEALTAKSKATFDKAVGRWNKIKASISTINKPLADLYDRLIARRLKKKPTLPRTAETITSLEEAAKIRARELPSRDTFGRRIVSREALSSRDLGLSAEEEAIMKAYSGKKYKLHSDQNLRNRTWENRLVDHELLLDSLMRPGNPQVATEFARAKADLGKEKSSLESLRRLFLGQGNRKVVFFDIGPGIGNVDLNIGGGKGKPAITSQEMAARFPTMEVIATDLPSEVAIFTGKAEGVSGDGTRFKVSPAERKAAMSRQNFHVMEGNGLSSLRSQIQDRATNPFPDRTRPQILPNTPIVVRMANSIDIYCSWDAKNGGLPSVKESLAKMATDFKSNPLMLLFNKEVLFKRAGETQWSIIGRTSVQGFYHNSRGAELGRQGQSPFTLDKAKIEQPARTANPAEEALRAQRLERQQQLAEIVRTKRSSRQQQEYLAREYGPKMRLPKALASQIPAMHPECRMSINLPAYKEGPNIYKALYEYTVRQTHPDGTPVNPNHFEINVFLNKPNSGAKFDKATSAEVARFQKDHPQYHVNIIEHSFNFTGKPVMGEIYKTMADTAVYRNLQRGDGVNKEKLILRTGAADAKEKSPLLLDSVISNFENPKLAVYKSESKLPQEVLDACPLLDIAYRVETGLNRLYTHAQSNLGLGSYSAEIYARVGGFGKKVSMAEEKDLSTRMAAEVRQHGELFTTKKDLHVNAIDDPRRIVWAMFTGHPMQTRYNYFGGSQTEKVLREVDWNTEIVRSNLPSNMHLTPENMSREMSAHYQSYINIAKKSQSMAEFKASNPRATKAAIQNKTYEIANNLFVRLFDSMGIPRTSYTFVREGKEHPAQIQFSNIDTLERGPLPSYQDFLISVDSIIK